MKPSSLQAAARQFFINPAVGDPSGGTTAATIQKVVGVLRAAVVLFEDTASRLCLVTVPTDSDKEEMREAIEATAGEMLGLGAEETVTVSSHNHCVPVLVANGTSRWTQLPGEPRRGQLTARGREFVDELRRAMERLREQLVPVTINWGIAREDRITYNRRGRRADGRSYFIREEDRLMRDAGYTGLIDPDATVVVLRGPDGNPVAALAHFTGHPVSAYHPEHPLAFGEWPQVACEKLSERLGGAPVAFLQGCAGDINSKYMLSGTVEQSRELGGQLGDSFVQALDSLRRSDRTTLRHARIQVEIPLDALPGEESLRRDLAEIDAFIRRAGAGDPDTLDCVGLNFPRALSPLYRARLLDRVRLWYEGALAIHREGRLGAVPKTLPMEIVVACIGDVGFAGMPFEAYVRTGLRIKRAAPLPCLLPCGYTLSDYGYVPDATSCADREYMSGFFRYTSDRPPFAPPAGDSAADGAVKKLRELSAPP